MMDDSTVHKINEYLKTQLWMDFEMCNMDRGKIELYGFLDEGGDEKIKIVFEQPYMVSCNFFFTYEGNSDFICIIDGEEALEINKKYGVIQGNLVYKITNNNIETDMFIAAKGIKYEISE